MPDTVEDALHLLAHGLDVCDDCPAGDTCTPDFIDTQHPDYLRHKCEVALDTVRAELTRLRTEVAKPVGDEAVREAVERLSAEFGSGRGRAFQSQRNEANLRDIATLTRALTTAQRDKERMEAVVEALSRANAEHDIWVSTGSDNAYDEYESAVWEAVNLATLDSKEA